MLLHKGTKCVLKHVQGTSGLYIDMLLSLLCCCTSVAGLLLAYGVVSLLSLAVRLMCADYSWPFRVDGLLGGQTQYRISENEVELLADFITRYPGGEDEADNPSGNRC